MKVGIYLDMRNPPPWRQDPARLYGFALEFCEEAERRGIDSVWVTEHHQFEDGYLPQPLTFASAIAARTKHVRIGTAVMLAPLHHPVEIAEQATIVDLVSNGRLDLGLGAGYRVPEFRLFGADLSKRYTTTDETVRRIRDVWSSGSLTPAPVQSPLPMWLGYMGPQGARRAGRLGEGLLSFDPKLLDPYREGLVEGGHDPAIARTAGAYQAWITNDPERTKAEIGQYVAYQLNSYRRYLVEGTDLPAPRDVDLDRVFEDSGRSLASFLVDTPENVANRVRTAVGDGPVDTVYFWASIAGMPEQMMLDHLALLSDQLAPRLRVAS